jgi:hypothetical protein
MDFSSGVFVFLQISTKISALFVNMRNRKTADGIFIKFDTGNLKGINKGEI